MRRASLAYLVVYAAVAAYVPYLTLYYQTQGLSLGYIGGLTALSSGTSLVAAPIWGTLHDRSPRSRILLPVSACLAAIGATSVLAVGPSPILPLAVMAFAAGMSGTISPMDVRVLDLAGPDRTAYASVRAFGSVGFMLLAPPIGLVAMAFGYGSIFLILVPLVIVGSVLGTMIPGRSIVGRVPGMLQAPGAVLRRRPIALYLFGALVAWTAIYAQLNFFSLYLQSLGAPAEVVGWAWSFGALMEVPTMLLFPRLARRFGLERLIIAGAAITLLRQVCNAAFTDPSVLLASSLLQGVGYALLYVGGIMFVSRNAPSGAAATAQGILGAVSPSLASVLGAGIQGQLAGLLTLRGAFIASTFGGLVGTLVITLVVLGNPTRYGWEAEPVPGEAFVPIESGVGFDGEPDIRPG